MKFLEAVEAIVGTDNIVVRGENENIKTHYQFRDNILIQVSHLKNGQEIPMNGISINVRMLETHDWIIIHKKDSIEKIIERIEDDLSKSHPKVKDIKQLLEFAKNKKNDLDNLDECPLMKFTISDLIQQSYLNDYAYKGTTASGKEFKIELTWE